MIVSISIMEIIQAASLKMLLVCTLINSDIKCPIINLRIQLRFNDEAILTGQCGTTGRSQFLPQTH